jgi:hypothetical protein
MVSGGHPRREELPAVATLCGVCLAPNLSFGSAAFAFGP